jgi:hypothetical protein
MHPYKQAEAVVHMTATIHRCSAAASTDSVSGANFMAIVGHLAGSHLIDQALCLFGSPSKVTGLVANQRHLPVCSIHDAFTMTLHYDRYCLSKDDTVLAEALSEPGLQASPVRLTSAPSWRFMTGGSYILTTEGHSNAAVGPCSGRKSWIMFGCSWVQVHSLREAHQHRSTHK